VIFGTPGRVDVKPPSVPDSLRECTSVRPRAYQAAVYAAVDNLESKVVKVFFSRLCERSSRNNFPQTLIAGRIDSISSSSFLFALRQIALLVESGR
jgi:hypothetical protein